ncbi:hypothetical protein [Vibrio cholerae]|uniref:hypothetical protein n=1 Tax=Vibrio cholerae TaxID=666 RepID=UPI0002A40306|nr:hypothetical protein [Vibrio cholerae]EGQ7944638.1 hypothetical protein [Vibrio cholerae]EKY32113.1 hypothetical protein OSU_2269 [Vibrio cholerae PS15]
MSIYEDETNLFNSWIGKREGFVVDGVVSEEHYINSSLKLCFVLKEVNDEGGGGWDLRQFIRDGARWQTWDNISRWVKCISKLDKDVSWSELANITEDDRKDTLKSICAMNLKKSPGGHTTIKASFNKVVAEDKEYIQKQYSLYNPDITVCCGTGWDFRWALDLDKTEVYETSRGISWFLNTEGKAVVMFAHPSARVQDSLLIYGLADAVREIMHNKRFKTDSQRSAVLV